VLRAGGETETTQENIKNWLDLVEGDPGFQLLTEEEIVAVIFFIYFHHILRIKFSIYFFISFPCLSELYLASLIRIIV
jgi:hypothetical protein